MKAPIVYRGDVQKAALHKTCSECGRPIEFSTDPAHYEDTWWLCDECLGKELGIL